MYTRNIDNVVMQSPGGITQVSCDSSEPSEQSETVSQTSSSEIHTGLSGEDSEHIISFGGQPA